MNIPVLLEPTANGFRASTGAPLNLSAEAPTEEQVLAMIQREYVLKQIAGAKIIELSVPDDKLVELTRKLAANPFLDEWDAATKAYRAEYEANEAAKEAASAKTQSPQPQEPAA